MAEFTSVEEYHQGNSDVPSVEERQKSFELVLFDAGVVAVALRAIIYNNPEMYLGVLRAPYNMGIERTGYATDLVILGVPENIIKEKDKEIKIVKILNFLREQKDSLINHDFYFAKKENLDVLLRKQQTFDDKKIPSYALCNGSYHKDLLDFFNGYLADGDFYIVSSGPKSLERSIEKVETDYNGAIKELKDAVRATLVYPDADNCEFFIAALDDYVTHNSIRHQQSSRKEFAIRPSGHCVKMLRLSWQYGAYSVTSELKIEPTGQQISNELTHTMYEALREAKIEIKKIIAEQDENRKNLLILEASIKLKAQYLALKKEADEFFKQQGDYINPEKNELRDAVRDDYLAFVELIEQDTLASTDFYRSILTIVELMDQLQLDVHVTSLRGSCLRDRLLREESINSLQFSFSEGIMLQSVWRNLYKELLKQNKLSDQDISRKVQNWMEIRALRDLAPQLQQVAAILNQKSKG